MKEREIIKIKQLYEKKNYKKAEVLCTRILKKEPNSQVTYLLAHIYFSKCYYNKALRYINKFLELENNFDGLLTKVYCLMKLKKYQTAIEILQTINKKTDPDVLTLLARNYFEIDNHNESEQLYKKAYNIKNDREKLMNLSSFYSKINKYSKALEVLEESIHSDSDFEIMLIISKYYAIIKNFSKSNFYLIKIIKKFPNKSDLYHKLGINFSIIGDANKALDNFNKATDIDINYGISHYQASKIKNLISEKKLEVLLSIYDEKKVIDENYIFLGLAISNYLEPRKEYSRSFYYLKKSNSFFKDKFIKEWSINSEFLFFKRVKILFNKFENLNLNLKEIKYSPIFILGLPRSGTTLIEQILASHPKIHAKGELPYIHNYFQKKFPFLFSREIKAPNEDYLSSLSEDLQKEYESKLNYKKFLITDKAPLNFMYLGFLKKIFNAKIILCTRNRKDNILSIFQTFFANLNYKYSYNLNDLTKYYELYADLLSFWKIKEIDHLQVKYEDVVNNKKFEINRILNYLKINYDKNIEKFYLNNRPVLTASYHQVRKPLYETSIDKWKNYEKDLEIL